MTAARPTFDEYRALSPEERELVRIGDALAFARGELAATVVRERAPLKRDELIAALAERAALDVTAATRALDALTAIVAGEVASYGSVTLPGLGKLALGERRHRPGEASE